MLRSFCIFIILLGLSFALVSCEDKNPVQLYGNTMVDSLKTAKKVERKVNVLEVQKSIQEFHAANDRYPADLNEIAAFNGIVLKSDKYTYNPETGTLSEK